MHQLIELYEMASVNETLLRVKEKQAMLKAKLALQMFERAMQDFKDQVPVLKAVA